MEKIKSHRSYWGVLGLSVSLALGCVTWVPFAHADTKPHESLLSRIVTEIKFQMQVLFKAIAGRRSEPQATPSPRPSDGALDSAMVTRNAEIIQEMFKVVLMQRLVKEAEIDSLVAAKNQGASLEGIYNGLSHSSHYRSLEQDHPTSSADALSVFAHELAALEAALDLPTRFDFQDTQPLSVSTPLDADDVNGAPEGHQAAVTEIDFPQSRPIPARSPQAAARADTTQLEAQYRKLFSGSSIFTLKRVLGDEALKWIANCTSRGTLVHDYGGFAAQMSGRKIGEQTVDYGIALRNRPDAVFHESWARQASPDALSWEVLNRYHRLMNQAQGDLK